MKLAGERERERENERNGEKERKERRRKKTYNVVTVSLPFLGLQRTRNNFSEGTPRPVHVGIELPPAFRYPVSRAWSAIRESLELGSTRSVPRLASASCSTRE